MNSSLDMTTIIFLIIAAVIFWRLRSVLGTRTGHERPPGDYFPKQEQTEESSNDNVIQLPKKQNSDGQESPADLHPDLIDDEVKFPWKKYAEEGSELAAGYDAIHAIDNSFHPRDFLDGAKLAYEMIVLSFASGDKDTLKPLLSDSVYDSFSGAIDGRNEDGIKTEMTFVGIQNAKIQQAEIEAGDDAHVTVRFVSELISATYDKEHKLIEGDPALVSEVVDVWTFSRALKSGDPNWTLVATQSE